MFSSAEEVLRFIAEENVEFVDVRFCDLPGTMQHFTVPTTTFGEAVFTDGLMFDGSSIRGFQQIHESDMQLLPDPSTAVIDPFRTRKTLNLTDAGYELHDQIIQVALERERRLLSDLSTEEVATLVTILASDRLANVTGSNYVIDGGLIKTI